MSTLNTTKTSVQIKTIATIKSSYYDDIMSTDDIICGAPTAAQGTQGTQGTQGAKPSVDCNYFANKRMGTKEQVAGIDGMDSMIIHTVGVRSHGIRAWEVARSDTYMRKQREMERRNQHHLVQKMKRDQTGNDLKLQKELKQQQKEEDERYFQQTRQAIESTTMPVSMSIATMSMEEDDPTW